MALNLEPIQELGKNQLDAVTSTTASTAKGLTAIANEAADYSKASFDNSRTFVEKMLRVQRLEDVIQAQSEFARTAYSDLMSRASKIGEIYSNLAKETFASATGVTQSAAKVAAETSANVLSETRRQTEQAASRAQRAAAES